MMGSVQCPDNREPRVLSSPFCRMTQPENGQEPALTRHGHCWPLGLGLPSHRNYEKEVSVAYKPPSFWRCSSSPEQMKVPTPATAARPPCSSRAPCASACVSSTPIFPVSGMLFSQDICRAHSLTPSSVLRRPLRGLPESPCCSEVPPAAGRFLTRLFSPLLCFTYLQRFHYLLA